MTKPTKCAGHVRPASSPTAQTKQPTESDQEKKIDAAAVGDSALAITERLSDERKIDVVDLNDEVDTMDEAGTADEYLADDDTVDANVTEDRTTIADKTAEDEG